MKRIASTLILSCSTLFVLAQTPSDVTLAETLELLSENLTEAPLNIAIDDIEAWEVLLNASDDPALQSMANQLGELRSALQAEPIDAQAVSQLLASLSDQTLEVAAGTEGETGAQLTRLSTLLRQASGGLAGGMTGGSATGGTMTGGGMTGGATSGGGN